MKHLKRIDENFDSTEDQDKAALVKLGLAEWTWDERCQKAFDEFYEDPEVKKAISLIRTKVEESVAKWIPYEEFEDEHNQLYDQVRDQPLNEIGVFEFFMFD